MTGVSRDDEIFTVNLERASDESTEEPERATASLEYPRHPFPPDLCTTIASLPDGFRELALSRHLSREVIDLIFAVHSQVFISTQETPTVKKFACTQMAISHAKRYLEASDRVTESIVCLSIIMISMRSFSYRFSVQDHLILKKLSVLASQRGLQEATSEQFHHFVWTIIMAAEASQCEPLTTYTNKLMSDLLGSTARHELKWHDFLEDWTKLEKILKKYFWRKDLIYEWKCSWESTMRSLRAQSTRSATSKLSTPYVSD